MNPARALLVDDEQDILELLRITLSRMGIDCRTAPDLAAARRFLATETFDLCLTDMRLPDGNGIDLVCQIASQFPQLPVAMITAHGSMDSAVAAMKAGAFDFVSKPVDLQVLRRLVEAALRLQAPLVEQGGNQDRPVLLGDSPAMVELRRLIAKLARNQAPVYVSGESGTGKELAARLIHLLGPRANAPFVPVNCGAIPPDLVESELFGHRKGAFTGAIADNPGLFKAADGGTLFLDEVAELPLPAQVKLLRVLQEKKARPVGGQREVPIDVRLISATHRDLAAEVISSRFRQDLFYRINVIELRLPPLRERTGDIPLLAEHFLARIARQNGLAIPRLSASALAALARHAFPGNVRELENVLERALALAESNTLEARDIYLPETLACETAAPVASSWPEEPTAPAVSLEDSLGEIQRQVILRALEDNRWNRTAAARQLGMSLRALRYRLTKLGIE
ncbi:MAG: sigma-54 dependent transcriptional regulator [Chromatiaceae bacterium]